MAVKFQHICSKLQGTEMETKQSVTSVSVGKH